MHKKPLVAVLLFGLLLVLPLAVSEARIDPGSHLTPGAQPLPYIARGLDKGPVGSATAFTDPSTNLQLGVSRTGATFCDGRWQGPTTYFIGGWFYGDEYYATYQDPEELGSCAGIGGLYTFDVTAINWHMLVQVAGIYNMQPIVYDEAGDIGCPVPGGVLCAGPVYAVDFTGGGPGGYLLSLPFPTECCVFNPYFAGVYFADFLGPDVVDVLVDAGPIEPCLTYNDFGGGFTSLETFGFNWNLTLWSEGLGFDQNLCPGLPGVCDYQAWYNDVTYFWQSPDGNGAEDYYTRFTADVSCTLQTFRFAVYCPAELGTTPTYRVTLFGTNGPVFAGRMYPQAFGVPFDPFDPNVVESFEIPHASIVCFPAWNEVDFTDYSFGPGQDICISVALSANTPDPLNDVIGLLTDDGSTRKGRSGFYVGVLSDWYYMDEVFNNDYDLVYEAFICCEQVEASEAPCAAPGPDDWSTYAHDYERTSATTIAVGDPCQINPIWQADQDNTINFTQATVANDRVYIANDKQNRVYDLTTGALINSISGLPHVFASSRSNMTIDDGSVFMTGGSGQSVGRWDYDLAVNAWVNGVGGTNPPLGANSRFGAVVYVPGLDIIVIGSENAKFWAFNALDGTLFGGWATNPLVLDGNVLHGAAYDGTALYVGTAVSALNNGSIYSIDPATGAINWNFVSGNGDGYPNGVSIDGADLYAASTVASAGTGFRYKIDKTTGAVIWSFGQQSALYGAPAIGRNFVYMSQDQSGEGGLLAIDKNTGAPVHNFASDGLGRVSAPVTVTCDGFVFAGDRNGFWWLLDAVNFVPVWNIEVPFFSPVFGTAVSSNVAGDRNFAIVAEQFAGPTAGLLVAYEFNSGPRPIVLQNTYSTIIGVEFGTGPGVPYTEAGVFDNIGCADLTTSAINIYDIAPDVTSSNFRTTHSQYAAALANRSIDANYNTYFAPGTLDKSQARLFDVTGVETSRYDDRMMELSTAMKSPNKRDNRRMAAGSSIVRTSAVSITSPLAAGSQTDVSWLYDGSNLERGVDVELLEFITNDPDRVMMGHQPILEVTYAGGCFSNSEVITWNTGGAASTEFLYNDGRLGEQNDAGDLDWMGTATQDIFSAAFYLAGEWDSVAIPPIVQFHTGDINHAPEFTLPTRQFLPDPWPGPDCAFRSDVNVPMGFKREGGCPGTATPIFGEWLRTAYIDTNIARVGTFGEAIGTRVELTEVGAYDPLYGDFKLLRWIVINRDAVDKGPLYAGSWIDWDVAPNYDANTAFLGLSYNGYGIYDHDTPTLAMGMFDPNMPTAYGGLDVSYNTPQRINPMGERPDDSSGDPSGNYDGPWQSPDTNPWEELWEYAITRLPAFEDGPQNLEDDLSPYEDHAGLLTNKGQMLPASDTIAFHQCLYAVDASSADETTMENLGLALAQRAAKWAGFARGDVNDDNTVNLLDVCWLLSGHQIYPDAYNGDVDLSGAVNGADEAYLLNYVTGLGPAPQGEWRFTF